MGEVCPEGQVKLGFESRPLLRRDDSESEERKKKNHPFRVDNRFGHVNICGEMNENERHSLPLLVSAETLAYVGIAMTIGPLIGASIGFNEWSTAGASIYFSWTTIGVAILSQKLCPR